MVCRSGALTVSEISRRGFTTALFVPFQHKDRHSTGMRCRLKKPAIAAKIFEQPQFTADVVATPAGWNRETLMEMAQRARAAAIPDATERVAKEVSLGSPRLNLAARVALHDFLSSRWRLENEYTTTGKTAFNRARDASRPAHSLLASVVLAWAVLPKC